jgi:hypothetical protein
MPIDSLLCAGIADPSLNEIVMPKLLTQGMLQRSKLAGFSSEWWPASRRNLQELRCIAAGGVWHIAFAFDPDRHAILLVGGDQSGGSEKRFYRQLITRGRRTVRSSPCDMERIAIMARSLQELCKAQELTQVHSGKYHTMGGRCWTAFGAIPIWYLEVP